MHTYPTNFIIVWAYKFPLISHAILPHNNILLRKEKHTQNIVSYALKCHYYHLERVLGMLTLCPIST